MSRLIALVLVLLPGLALGASPYKVDLTFLEPPPIHMAGGYVIELDATTGTGGPVLDELVYRELTDPTRGSEARRLPAVNPRPVGPDFLAVRPAPGLLASAAAPAREPGPGGQSMRVQVALEDPEFWEGWKVDQFQTAIDDASPGSWSFCLTREATVRGRLRAVDGHDGSVLAEVPIKSVDASQACGDTRREAEQQVVAEVALAQDALTLLAVKVANQVAPRWETVPTFLVRKGGAARGHKLLRAPIDLRTATRWFVDRSAAQPDDPWLRYHAAVLLTAGFHFAEARDHLAAARELSDELLFSDWEEELHRRERAVLVLRRLGVPQEPVAF